MAVGVSGNLISRAKPALILGAGAVVILVCVLVGMSGSPVSNQSWDPARRHQLLSVASTTHPQTSLRGAKGGGPQHQTTGTLNISKGYISPFISLIRSPATSTTTASTIIHSNSTPSPSRQAPPPPTRFPSFQFSKTLFVRAVYFDDRPRDGHKNVSVFLVVCLRNITDNSLIVGCQVDDVAAKDFTVKLIGETPLWRAFYDYINHEEVLVHCYDLPARNGSSAHIAYRKSKTSEEITLAASERPLFFPAPRIPPTSEEGRRYDMTIMSCAKVFNHPPWMQKWLTYQRTLGVDHVHIDAEDTFERTGEMKKPYFAEMMREGFVSVDIWKKYLSPSEIWYHNQGLIYEDCPYRFRGTYDYIVMMDTDDFFTPRDPAEKKIHYYIDKYCRGGRIGSCKFKWVEYYPDAYGMYKNVSTDDGNVTRALKSYTHYNQGNPKSLHRTTVLVDTATHYAYSMIPGYSIVKVPVEVAYVAHVRLYKKPGRSGMVPGLPNTCSEHILSKYLLLVVLNFVFVTLFFICT